MDRGSALRIFVGRNTTSCVSSTPGCSRRPDRRGLDPDGVRACSALEARWNPNSLSERSEIASAPSSRFSSISLPRPPSAESARAHVHSNSWDCEVVRSWLRGLARCRLRTAPLEDISRVPVIERHPPARSLTSSGYLPGRRIFSDICSFSQRAGQSPIQAGGSRRPTRR